jgi:uncharacterized membrane protein
LLLAAGNLNEDNPCERIGSAVIVLAALIGGIALRWVWLGRASLWYDEGYTAWMVSHPAREIIRLIRFDTAPPLYYLLLRAWVNCFGSSEFALRSMSALISSIALMLFYPLVMKVLRDRLVSSLALVLFAISFMQVEHGREARFYPMMALLGEIGLLLVLRALKGRAVWVYLALILTWTASLYTNNMMAFYLVGLAIAWLILPGERTLQGRMTDLIIVSFVTALLYLPWIPTAIAQAKSIQGNFWTPTVSRAILARSALSLAEDNHDGSGPWNPYATRIFAVMVSLAVLLGLLRRETFRWSVGLGAFGFLPILLAYLYSRVHQSILIDRSFIASTVAFPLLLVLPFIWLRFRLGRWMVFACAPILIVPRILSLQSAHLTRSQEDWRSICQELQMHPADRQLTIFVGNEGELLYDYYARSGDYSPCPELTGVPGDFFAMDPPHTMRRVSTESDIEGLKKSLAIKPYDRVVLVDIHPWFTDKNHITPDFLHAVRLPIGTVAFGGIMIHRWGPANDSETVKVPNR